MIRSPIGHRSYSLQVVPRGYWGIGFYLRHCGEIIGSGLTTRAMVPKLVGIVMTLNEAGA